jgi:hypothetical protein
MKIPNALIFILVLFLIVEGARTSLAQQPGNDDPGLKKYGNVAFADSLHHKYPIDTDKHIRIAWAFLHQKSHSSKYTKSEKKEMLRRIREAAEANGIHFKSKG